jgi:hypothetical protein
MDSATALMTSHNTGGVLTLDQVASLTMDSATALMTSHNTGGVLTLDQVADCFMEKILPHRPVEVWLSDRGGMARFGTLFTMH